MFDISVQMMIQLVGLIPAYISLYFLFDIIGSFLFGRS